MPGAPSACCKRDAEGREGGLHPGRGIAQPIKILHGTGKVADLQLDAVARKDAGVLPRKVVVPRSCRPGRDCEATWGQGIDQAIDDVQRGNDNGCQRNHKG
jgi:hypothetical protein